MREGSIFASHYVINDILITIERGNHKEIKKICEKYISRYKSDDELFMVCSRILFEDEISNPAIEELKKNLYELYTTRKLETSGGADLWLKNRRSLEKQ